MSEPAGAESKEKMEPDRLSRRRNTATLLKHFPTRTGGQREILLRRERSDDCFKARIAA